MKLFKRTLLVASLLTLAFLAAAAVRENYRTEWRGWQRRYRAALLERATTPAARAEAAGFEVRPRQLVVPALNATTETVDRCVSCHVGIDDPRLAGAQAPLAPHSGTVLRSHPPERFGCTVCHRGQGRAMTLREAKATDVFWDYPLLPARYTQASCGSCHDPAYLADKGAPVLAAGARLFETQGCRACHREGGLGGGLGLALDVEGTYTKHHYVMTAVTGDATSVSWLEQHFRDPQAVIPGSTMKTRGLTPAQVQALTTYMLSLRGRQPAAAAWTAPDRYRAIAARLAATHDGADLYTRLCRTCHGEGTFGAWDKAFGRFVPAIRNPAYLARARAPYLRATIRSGRPTTLMAGFEGGLPAPAEGALVGWLTAAAPPEPPPAPLAAGDAGRGATTFAGLCAGCHGAAGEGLVAPQLANPVFQRLTTDDFIAATIRHGRPRTAMPAFQAPGAGLAEGDVADLVAAVRALAPAAAKGTDHGI
ncbi:MAG TPA: c-type cytochrome [Polyangia bacterium]|jgi:mono/diheme cytochrome c family protein/cytochrome c2/nitrate reductase cytochrome c-type subunit